jgi:hypothetical protein
MTSGDWRKWVLRILKWLLVRQSFVKINVYLLITNADNNMFGISCLVSVVIIIDDDKAWSFAILLFVQVLS